MPESVSTCIVLATAFHPSCLIGCASAIFSDLTFCALTYLVFLTFRRPRCIERGGRRLSAVLNGVLSGASVLVRSNGVTLVLATLATSWRRTDHHPLRLAGSLFGLALVLAGSWLIPVSTNRVVPSGDYKLEMKAAWSSPAAGVEIVGRNLRAIVLDYPTRVILPMTTYVSPVRQLMERQPALWLALRLGCSSVVLVGLITLARAGRGRACGVWVHGIWPRWPSS